MDPSRSGTFFDRLFDSDSDSSWGTRASWKAQKIAWKAQRQTQRAAWRAQRDAQRAAWKAQWHADRWASRGPFAIVWGLFWVAFWVGFGLLMAFSPEFREGVMGFAIQVSKWVVHVLHVLAGHAEI